LCSGFAVFDQAEGVSNLTVRDPSGSTAEILSSCTPFGDRIIDAFVFDLVLHLRESRHDREQHRAHGCGSVDVATAKVQDAQAPRLLP
jgi:hypothetical protein